MSTPRAATRYKINLKIEPAFRRKLDPAVLRAAARAALTDQAAPAPCELTILIAGDGELRTLNRDFLGIDQPTDVLSFPPDDLAISFDRAAAQAAKLGHSVEDELRILMLHGLLHLAGMDHEADGGAMKRTEARWRKRLGLPSGLIERSTA